MAEILTAHGGQVLAETMVKNEWRGNMAAWQELYARMIALNSNEKLAFIKRYLQLSSESLTMIKEAVDYLSKEQFANIVSIALDDLKQKRENGVEKPKYVGFVSEDIIKAASWQFPDLLQAHIQEIEELDIYTPNLSRTTPLDYCPNTAYHLIFEPQYGNFANKPHPTYNLPKATGHFAFGGVLEGDDTNPLHHLITLDPIPQGLMITKLSKLVLGMHLRTTDCYDHFYRHNDNGYPTVIDTGIAEIDLNNNYAIKPAQAALALTPQRWLHQDWAQSNDKQNLFKIGGEPTWIQDDAALICPICGAKMDFLMQLDTGLPDADTRCEDGEIFFGSGGILYTFWCDKCKVSGYTGQWT